MSRVSEHLVSKIRELETAIESELDWYLDENIDIDQETLKCLLRVAVDVGWLSEEEE